jgi:cell division protein FtsN
MKELITIATSFLVVVALAFYMYVSTQKHSIAVTENQKLHEVVKQNHDELKQELESLKEHIRLMVSIYHKQ